jgi:hypothetical protein
VASAENFVNSRPENKKEPKTLRDDKDKRNKLCKIICPYCPYYPYRPLVASVDNEPPVYKRQEFFCYHFRIIRIIFV